MDNQVSDNVAELTSITAQRSLDYVRADELCCREVEYSRKRITWQPLIGENYRNLITRYKSTFFAVFKICDVETLFSDAVIGGLKTSSTPQLEIRPLTVIKNWNFQLE
ncbi:hypothetical protein ACFE04_000074 [Oxalis oulophora]